MHEKMKVLISLQKCDICIQDIKRKKDEAPVKIDMLKGHLAVIKDRLDEESNQLDKLKNEARQIDNEIEDLEGRIEKSKIKLSNIKSNKEYHAALKEIDDLNVRKTLLEDRAIELMEEIEAAETIFKATNRQLNEAEEKFEKDCEKVLQEIKTLQGELDELEQERVGLCEAIDEDLLRRYNDLREHRGGIAISAVLKGVCQTCHLGIPPQKFNELIRGDQLMSCPNCSRIIYWGEDERFQDNIDKGG